MACNPGYSVNRKRSTSHGVDSEEESWASFSDIRGSSGFGYSSSKDHHGSDGNECNFDREGSVGSVGNLGSVGGEDREGSVGGGGYEDSEGGCRLSLYGHV